MDNTFIVIQGYSISPETLQTMYDEYSKLGFKNILTSTYSTSIPSNFKGECIINDDILGKYDRNNYLNCPGLNYQILTTKKAINYIKEKYPNTKYILKIRADHFLDKSDKFVESWIEELENLEPIPNSPFEKKIVTMGLCTKYHSLTPGVWYISDYFNFGTLNDMSKLWNISTTFVDNGRAEDYISTFYLYKYFSKETDEFIAENLSNGSILKYNLNVLDYFMFDWRTHSKALYSYKLSKFANEFSDTCRFRDPQHSYPFKQIS